MGWRILMLGWGVRESVLAGQVGVSRQYKITVLICCEYNEVRYACECTTPVFRYEL